MKVLRQIGSVVFVAGLFYVMVADDPVVPWWLRIAVFCLLGGILVVLLTVALEQRKEKRPAEVPPQLESEAGVLLLNSAEVPGRKHQILGLVQGHTIFAIWLGKDL